MLTLAQLRVFDAVARHRHFTRAAESLLIAQPSVSYQIRELERELKVRLVEVVGRRVYLTDAGERLAARTAKLLSEIEDVEQEIQGYGTGETGRLRLGATRTVGGYALPEELARFRAAHPGIDLHLSVDNTRAIEQMLIERTIDMGVVEWTVESPSLASTPIGRDTLVLVARPDHPLATRRAISVEDLRGESFVMREPGSGTRALANQALGPVQSEINIAMELDQPEAIVRAVAGGLGISFISQVIAAPFVDSGILRVLPIVGDDLCRDFSLVVLRDRPDSPAMKTFRTFIVEAWKLKQQAPFSSSTARRGAGTESRRG